MITRRELLLQTVAGSLAAGTQVQDAQDSSKDLPIKTRRSKTVKIPNTDLVVSRVAYGGATLGWNPDYENGAAFRKSLEIGVVEPLTSDAISKGQKLIETAYENGVNLFDLAHAYGGGKSERIFGLTLRRSPGFRNRVVIQSKCGGDHAGLNSSYKHIVDAVAESLSRLGTQYLDILLLHASDYLVEPDEVARAFEKLQKSGMVRYFGVSNHTVTQIELLKRSVEQPLVINQIKLGLASCCPIAGSFVDARYSDLSGIVDYCRSSGMLVQAYSPLKGESFWGPTLLTPPSDAAPEFRQAADVLAETAKEVGATPAQLMLAWLLRHPAGIVTITGATKPEHIIENCAADQIEVNRQHWYTLFEAAIKFQRK